MDQLVRSFYCGTRITATRNLLLEHRYQRISPLGVAVRSLWRQRAGAFCRLCLDGESDGTHQVAARRRYADLFARMDLSQPVLELGVADQCFAVLRHRIYPAVALVDVVALSQTDLYQSVKEEKQNANVCRADEVDRTGNYQRECESSTS